MLNFYGKFIPNLSSILEPLHSLLRKDVVWKWEVEQQEAFDKAENQLQSSDVLVHWSRERAVVHHPTVLAQFYPMLCKMDQKDLWHTPRVHSQRQKGTTVTWITLKVQITLLSEKKHRALFAFVNSRWMRRFFCRFVQMLSTAATIEVSVVYLQYSVPCHVNLLAGTVFKTICFPLFSP